MCHSVRLSNNLRSFWFFSLVAQHKFLAGKIRGLGSHPGALIYGYNDPLLGVLKQQQKNLISFMGFFFQRSSKKGEWRELSLLMRARRAWVLVEDLISHLQ